MTASRKVVLVGHCGPDSHMLRSAVRRAHPHAVVEQANDEHALATHLTDDALLLINRVLDGGFSFDSGIGLIETLSRSDNPPLMMLVSNYIDAQERAIAAGAIPGFGKTHVHSDSTAQLLRSVLAIDTRVQ